MIGEERVRPQNSRNAYIQRQGVPVISLIVAIAVVVVVIVIINWNRIPFVGDDSYESVPTYTAEPSTSVPTARIVTHAPTELSTTVPLSE